MKKQRGINDPHGLNRVKNGELSSIQIQFRDVKTKKAEKSLRTACSYRGLWCNKLGAEKVYVITKKKEDGDKAY